jgi:hypothetical protein
MKIINTMWDLISINDLENSDSVFVYSNEFCINFSLNNHKNILLKCYCHHYLG